MGKEFWYLLGWIGGSILGGSIGLGHQSQWATIGPPLGVIFGTVISILGFGGCVGVLKED